MARIPLAEPTTVAVIRFRGPHPYGEGMRAASMREATGTHSVHSGV